MTTYLAKLLDVGGLPFSPALDEPLGQIPRGIDRALLRQLVEMLRVKNGFLAFESALEVFPADDEITDRPTLVRWNSERGWRRHYAGLPSALLFFAQDVVCCQLGLADRGVWKLDPESGTIAAHSDSMDEWANRVLDDYSYESGWKLAHDWQLANRPLRPGERLLPRVPFVLGGEYVAENLVAVDSYEGMESVGGLYKQIATHSDGTVVTVKNWIGAIAR